MALSIALAKQHLRLDADDDDLLVETYLSAAQAWVENYTGKLLTRRMVSQTETRFGAFIPLFYGPSPEGVEITYADGDADQTITDARIVRDRLYPLSTWPAITTPAMIVVTYTAGYDEVPGDLVAAVLLLTADFNVNREAGAATPAVTAAVQALCSPYRAVLV